MGYMGKERRKMLPEVLAVTEIPGRGMTHQLPSLRLLDDGVLPELLRHACQVK